MCPFSVVSNEGFRRSIEPNYKLPSPQTIVRYTEKRYKDLLPQVTACRPKDGKFTSLTTDLWISRTTTSYKALTGQFITENFVLKNFVLKAEHFEERHTALHPLSAMRIYICTAFPLIKRGAHIYIYTCNF